jgi:hypothetical protein
MVIIVQDQEDVSRVRMPVGYTMHEREERE